MPSASRHTKFGRTVYAIGGTLLTGGMGTILGSVVGVLVYGTIQVLVVFQGTLNAWWTRITIGFLVFVFCVVQRLFERRRDLAGRKITARQAAGSGAASA